MVWADARKLQAPSPKLQRNTKLQIGNAPYKAIESLIVGASLDLGSWNLELLFKNLSSETRLRVSQWRVPLSSRPIVPGQICRERPQGQAANKFYRLLTA